MKNTTYVWIGVVVVAIIIIAIAYNRPVQIPSIVQACLDNGGSFDATRQVCLPPAGTPSSKTPPAPAASAGTPKSVPKTGSTGTMSVTAETLPIYPGLTTSSTTQIQLTNPPSNTIISSPLTVSGLARGSWFFEATFPIYLTDAKGRILAKGQARAQSNWQTNDFVPFLGTLTFTRQPTGAKGYLILKKDNPSGLPKNDASVQVQETFQ